MDDWISELFIFSAGVAGGVLVMSIKPFLSAARRRRTELVAARKRILADIEKEHEKEILHEAFRTTEAIRGELDQSLRKLTKTLDTVLTPVAPQRDDPKIIHLSDPMKSKRSAV